MPEGVDRIIPSPRPSQPERLKVRLWERTIRIEISVLKMR